MPRSVSELLRDMRMYSEACRNMNAGKSYLAYSNDEKLRFATERCLTIIGEALLQAVKLDVGVISNVSNTWQIINLRHRLVHAYYKTYDPVVWSIVHEELSGLEESWQTSCELET